MKNLEKFKDWLRLNGAEVLSTTNAYEILRFRAKGAVHVVYTGRRGLSIPDFVKDCHRAFERGLKRLGYTDIREYRCGRNWPKCPDDLLVVWNLMRGPDEDYASKWEQRGGTVIVCENGYLQQVDKTHYAISTHGHNGSGWFPAVNPNPAAL